MGNVPLSGRIYDWLLEPILRVIKRRVARIFSKYDLFPGLDICCGTGTQCHLLDRCRHNVAGLDRNFKILKYARAKYPAIPFVCADAANIPIKGSCFKGILISYSLHDKPPELRLQILAEAKRLLAPGGKIILVDFEQPWNRRSRLGGFLTGLIERLAGREHFRNGRQFLRDGGLRAILEKNGLVELERYNIELGNSAIVITKFSH